MQEIELTRGLVTVVSDEDYEELSKHLWHANSGGYAIRAITDLTRKKKQIFMPMHRAILDLPLGNGLFVDHIDGDKLNNQRANLRICTTAENMRNRRMQCNNTSGFKGVYVYMETRWRACIGHNDKAIHIGVFDTKEEAYEAYCQAARELHGEFANLG